MTAHGERIEADATNDLSAKRRGDGEASDWLEFGGVPGALALMLGLPALTAYLFFAVRLGGGALWPGTGADVEAFLASLWPTWEAAAVYTGWIAFQAWLQAYAPGPEVLGVPLDDSTRLRYRMNGRSALVMTFAVVAIGIATGTWPLRWIHDHFGELISVITLYSFALAAGLFVYGRIRPDPSRARRSAIQDFFLGSVRNPRLPPVHGFDLKIFCEARPGLIGWMLVNLSFAAVQLERHGSISLPMLVVCGLQLAYVVDYYWHEPAILTTMDIQREDFGFMLVFGDLAWVPLTYSLQAHYLIDHSPAMPIWLAVACIALGLLGLVVFRMTNLQKHRFRTQAETAQIWGRKAEFIETRRGKRLLVSGFWGWSRHMNYLGDWLLGLAWSLPCAFGSMLPYFYPIYLAVLLVHRERRDHHNCAKQYGEDWARYCKRVPWRIVPGVY